MKQKTDTAENMSSKTVTGYENSKYNLRPKNCLFS